MSALEDGPPHSRITSLPTAWTILSSAVGERRTVRARYHGHLRVLSPHALGWKNGRAKALVYQSAVIGDQSSHDPRGWRSLFVDEIEDATVTDDRWTTADNYTPVTTGMDLLAIAVAPPASRTRR
jgi:hypothetical protein